MGGHAAWLCAEPGGPGKYQLVGKLGTGGMASIYLAVACESRGFDKLVVVKMLRARLAQDPDFVEMFLQEGRLAARLNHPNVVQTNAVIDNGTDYALVMEYLEGQTLRAWFNRARERAAFSIPMALRVLSDILSGLHYVHELCDFDGKHLELVHRDISPHNIFITFEGQSKVVDFGIAKAVAVAGDTRRGGHKGKLRYMSPEQAKGDPLDRRADIYSVGAILWEIATGHRLWKGMSDQAVMDALWQGQSPCTEHSRPFEACSELIAICQKALRPRREDRYPSCVEIQADIERLLDGSTQRWSSRDVGTALRGLFDDVYRERKSMIALQLAERELVSRTKASKLRREQPSTSNDARPFNRLSVPVFPSSARDSDPGTDARFRGSDTPAMPDQECAHAPDLISTQQLEQAAHSTSRSRLGSTVAVLVLGFGALTIIGLSRLASMHGSPPDVFPQAVAATPSLQSSVIPAGPAKVKEIRVTVWTSPPNASVSLNGRALHGNPASARLNVDSTSLHRIRVEAQGYETRNIEVLLDADKEILVPLPVKDGVPAAVAPSVRN